MVDAECRAKCDMLQLASKILGVAKDADDDTLKKAYKKLALKHHPGKSWSVPCGEETAHS